MPITRARDSSRWPPVMDYTGESPDDMARRTAVDSEAKLASDKIDDALSLERARRKKNCAVKILLLGQSESGKSTTLRNFQLNLAPRAFNLDAEAWRTVIHLNLLISVNYLIDVLKSSLRTDIGGEPRPSYSTATTPSKQLIEREKLRLRSLDGSLGHAPGSSSASGIETTLRQRLGADTPTPLAIDASENLQRQAFKNRMKGVVSLDISTKLPSEPFPRPGSAQSLSSASSSSVRSRGVLGLRRHSVSSSASSAASSASAATASEFDQARNDSWTSAMPQDGQHPRLGNRLYSLVDSFAVRVRGSTGWKQRVRSPDPDNISPVSDTSSNGSATHPSLSKRSSYSTLSEQREHEFLSARQIIQVFGEDIDRLWRNTDLEGQPGFFLNDALRVTALDYIPTTADILRARLSTTGVEEHRLILEAGAQAGKEWIIYDVGGFRSQRAAWAPFFDSVNAIIFLAPISAFDEWLTEDPNVNRLEDTFDLWSTICGSRLLASVEFILFLNKYDILRAKLRAGARFADYVVNYNDENGKKNDAESIARYMLATFNAAHKQLSPKPRKLRTYLTSVIDSRATSKVVHHIREQVLIGYLTESSVI
ncbi:G-alpha-domain-containing protein [Phellopilus nigrolimitatus]|nr:G-alpha-domain-containing protein [Phellopilus nigrolimitatus]